VDPRAEDLDLDLDFQLDDAEADAPETINPAAETEEIDFSELEDILSLKEHDSDALNPKAEDLDLDLDFQLDDAEADAPESTDPAAELEEFDLSGLVDSGTPKDEKSPEDVPVPPSEAPVAHVDSDELDVSEIEEMLEIDEGSLSDETMRAELEELELELAPEVQAKNEGLDDELKVNLDAEELDLSNIEKMLEMDEAAPGEENASDALAETQPDFALDPVEKAQKEPEDSELEFELDKSYDHEKTEPADEINTDHVASADARRSASAEEDGAPDAERTHASPTSREDIELEFELLDDDEELSQNDGGETNIPEETEQALTAEKETSDDPLQALRASTAAAENRKASQGGRKKSALIPILVTLVALLLGISAVAIFRPMGITIPFISDLLSAESETTDPGNLKLTTFDINSSFVDNKKVGKLFVITGQVKNGYAEPRSRVKMTGKLYMKGKKLAKTETIYCGNILSDQQLQNMDAAMIKKRLSNQIGDDRSNTKIVPGKALPFMIVFSNLPSDLEEFTVEATGSSQG
jgi:hypothetical protein